MDEQISVVLSDARIEQITKIGMTLEEGRLGLSPIEAAAVGHAIRDLLRERRDLVSLATWMADRLPPPPAPRAPAPPPWIRAAASLVWVAMAIGLVYLLS